MTSSLLALLVIVGCATSASIKHRGKEGIDMGSWCRHASTADFFVDLVMFGDATWNCLGLPGAFNQSLPSIAKFDKAKLDGFMKTINATKSWTTGTYTVDCANAALFPDLTVLADLFGALNFKPSDYIDLKNARVGQCEVLLQPASYPSSGTWTFGNLTLQKYCGAKALDDSFQ